MTDSDGHVDVHAVTTETSEGKFLAILGEYITGIPKFLYRPISKAVERLIFGAANKPLAIFNASAADTKHRQQMTEKNAGCLC